MWLVPASTGSERVGLWLCALGAAHPPAEVQLRVVTGGRSWHSTLRCGWFPRDFGALRVWTARSGLTGLTPDTRYGLRLLGPHGEAMDGARVRTLPRRVPPRGQGPLSLMLGSCFSEQRDGGVALATAARRLDGPELPHLKVLCGDQVYLDLPATESLPSDPAALRERLVGKYLRHWAPGHDVRQRGFGALLRQGGNVLVSDDHEFWNNFPFAQAQLKRTWRQDSRRELEAACRELLHTFQYPGSTRDGPPLQRVVVGEPGQPGGFELVALDGRAARKSRHAHDPVQLAGVCQWLRELRGPAALVLSQPLFENAQSRPLWARVKDAALSDLEDYTLLARALSEAPHDVVVLSGDIHGGRVACAQLPSGRQLYEVVSSPLGLVQPGHYHEQRAFGRFPVAGERVASPTTCVGPIRADHFAKLFVERQGRGLRMCIHFETTAGHRAAPSPFAFTLY